MKHSRLSPSSAGQWINCPGSVQLQEQFPEDGDNQPALDGTLCHAVAAYDLGAKETPVNRADLTDEITDAAAVYVNAVNAVTGGAPVHIEKLVAIPMVHELCFGTPDAWWFDVRTHTLHVWDLKFGWGIVDVVRCWQLILYALGLMADGVYAESVTIELHIVQPRPWHPDGPVRTWKLPYPKLAGYLTAAQVAAKLALTPEPPVKTGPWCRYCRALTACGAATDAVGYAVDVTGLVAAPTPSAARIGYELMILRRAAEMVNHRLAAVEQTAIAMDKRGEPIPGWTREHSAGNLEWNAGKESEIRAMANLCGVNLDKPPALITPIQAIKAGLPAEAVGAYATRKTGKSKMVPVKDSHVKRIFENE